MEPVGNLDGVEVVAGMGDGELADLVAQVRAQK
jgi:hypothetical protein